MTVSLVFFDMSVLSSVRRLSHCACHSILINHKKVHLLICTSVCVFQLCQSFIESNIVMRQLQMQTLQIIFFPIQLEKKALLVLLQKENVKLFFFFLYYLYNH